MNIKINRNSESPLYKQIKNKILNLILNNEIIDGYKLPSERKLAEELDVHRNTVVKAYDELIADGYVVVSRKKPKGYFVRHTLYEENFSNRFFPLEKMIKYRFNHRERLFLDIFQESKNENSISLAGINMDGLSAPFDETRDFINHIMSRKTLDLLNANSKDENLRIKENICKILSGENMYVSPKNIQIVSETNQALSYLADLYLDRGDAIVVEAPMVPDNAGLIRNKGIKIIPLPMHKDGMDIEQLENVIKKHSPKFIYTMPSYHNPTGITMSLEKRLKLLNIANSYAVPIIEEDSQRDFKYNMNRLPTLYSLDKTRSVIYIDSFTLTFPYGIKTGYIVAPFDTVEMLEKLIIADETCLGSIGQYLLNEFIEGGFYHRHIDKIATYYKNKRDLVCEELDKLSHDCIKYIKPDGGLLIWCDLPKEANDRKVYGYLKERGVLIMPGFVFYPEEDEHKNHIRICFSHVEDCNIVKGIKMLGEAIRNV